MKTLIITALYSNLWNTEFGGKSHVAEIYKNSLLNILNLNPTKLICFTSEEEIENLNDFFFERNNISREKLEFRPFDLTNSKYFKKLNKKKDLELSRTSETCFEIQYNKFYWIDELIEIFDYDKVYWIDADLSNAGIIPQEFALGEGFERNFRFNIFNEKLLQKLNTHADEKLLIFGKNNESIFHKYTTLPVKYYNSYDKKTYIICKLFGGSPNIFKKVIKKFDDVLVNLLISEEGLFHEEQILTNIFYNNNDLFDLIEFDEIFINHEKFDENTKYLFQTLLVDSLLVENNEMEINEVVDEFELKVTKIIEKYLLEKKLI